MLSTELNDGNDDNVENGDKEDNEKYEREKENTEYKIKIIKMIGNMDKLSLIIIAIFIAEKKLVPGIFLLFALVYWSFSFLCYFNLFTHFSEID